MACLRQVTLTVLFYVVIQLKKTTSIDSAVLYRISKSSLTIYSRIGCDLIVQCTGELNDGQDISNFNSPWQALGNVNSGIDNSSTILVTTEQLTSAGKSVFISNLTFSPVLHKDFYLCSSPKGSTQVTVEVDQEYIEIVNPIPNVDISDKQIGDTITLSCEVDTCLTDIRVSIYKGPDLVHSISSIRNRRLYVYQHQVSKNSVGNYSYRVSSRLLSTPLMHFTITGSPIPAATS